MLWFAWWMGGAQAASTYEELAAEVGPLFDRRLEEVQGIEAQVRPTFEKALAIQDPAEREALLLQARRALFDADERAIVPVTEGLSWSIALELARLYQGRPERRSDYYREFNLVDQGHPWVAADDERAVYLRERSSLLGLRPDETVERSQQAARKRKRGAAKEGRDAVEPKSMLNRALVHTFAVDNSFLKAGKTRFRVEVQPTAVKDGKMVFSSPTANDDRPTSCKDGEVLGGGMNGVLARERTCVWPQVPAKHHLYVAIPDGVDVKMGDTVTFYGTVTSTEGEMGVQMDQTSMVHVRRGGKTTYAFGVPTARPLHFQAHGSSRLFVVRPTPLGPTGE